ncbi:transmembrane emp24 domain-containing protein 7-like [Macrosteles quadrilineatus]|uniref:transmembrane emp24 domain-containing protein 7-like n=1 Tax=Macrosteles quadrilineatus TaxID=74068 RepID=UPI0023E2CA3E|nr:transmembrane emp24 domain-containing protein 7-like [Macrosteles quadrilineatus]
MWSLIWLLLALPFHLHGTQLTFDLAENSEECFYEEATKGCTVSLEYQVVAGGSNDVAVIVKDPTGRTVYQQDRSEYDSVALTAVQNGSYVVCFGNQFSTFTSKRVFMDFEVSDLPSQESVSTAMTQLESSLQNIQDSLDSIVNHQTHHRLREAHSRMRADDLNHHVLWLALAKTTTMLLVSVTMVIVVKTFFSYRNPYPYTTRL